MKSTEAVTLTLAEMFAEIARADYGITDLEVWPEMDRLVLSYTDPTAPDRQVIEGATFTEILDSLRVSHATQE